MGSECWELIISMDDSEARSLEQAGAFLAGSGDMRFAGQSGGEIYGWTERTLVRFEYGGLGKRDKGLVRRYIARMTGLSRAQVTRLIACYSASGRVKRAWYQRRKFATRYSKADIELLAHVDRSHVNLSGPATRRILQREYGEYGQAAFERLAQISVAQIYRFRNSEAYRKRNASYQPTRPTPVPIGARRKPRPQGRPGYLRIDTVHQGDRDGVKGVYHINAVDEVTQWEIVAAAPQISEYWLIPVLQQLLEQFPFTVRGFHSDNGSEFINYTVAKLLDKLLIEQTKSRAHRTGDNGLVESKNGAIIRKHMGFGHIGAQHAETVERFHRRYLNSYLNFHRPCAVAEIVEQSNGKRRRFIVSGRRPSRSSAVCGSAKFTCGRESLWRNWNDSLKSNPIPNQPSRCSAQKNNCFRQSPGKAHDLRLKIKIPEPRGNDGADGKGEENQQQVSLAFPPRPWKSLPRFPHFHRAGNGFPCSQNQNERSPWLPTFICSVQAHSSMRKCSDPEAERAGHRCRPPVTSDASRFGSLWNAVGIVTQNGNREKCGTWRYR